MDELEIGDLPPGVIKPRKKRGEPGELPEPAGNVSDEVMEKIWREEREDR
jgi:hypothetical protein